MKVLSSRCVCCFSVVLCFVSKPFVCAIESTRGMEGERKRKRKRKKKRKRKNIWRIRMRKREKKKKRKDEGEGTFGACVYTLTQGVSTLPDSLLYTPVTSDLVAM